tara:strand:+ start:242 stop:637 length:396 start_codon:yes stop_codon:yes gene_type:complete
MNVYLFFIYIILGFVSGLFLGSIGVGAGLLTIPVLIKTGLTIKESVVISLIVQLIPQTIPGVIAYYNQKLIKVDIVYIALLIMLGSFFGVYIGANASIKNYISNKLLYRILTIVLFMSSIYLYYNYWNHID